MKKSLRFISVIFALAIVFSLSVCAHGYSDKVYDGAGLLSDYEKEELTGLLANLSENCGADIIVATFKSMDGSGYDDIETFADYYVLKGDFNEDAVALVVSMKERNFHISTRGKCIEYLTDYGLDSIVDEFASYLGNGEYYNAFAAFGSKAASLYTSGENGDIYDTWIEDEPSEGEQEKNFPAARSTVISAILGVVSAFLGTSPMKSQLKSVGVRDNARNYAVSDSLNLVSQNDIFLYSNVSAVPKPKDTDTRGGSGSSGGHFGGSTIHTTGGTTFGGRSGKF